MGLFDMFNIAVNGMSAERDQMDLIADNIANVNTTHTLAGGPYRRKVAVIGEKEPFDNFFVPAAFGWDNDDSDDPNVSIGQGSQVERVVEDPAPFKKVYDPHNPQADAQGYVTLPNVDLISEMTNMIQTQRAYDANATCADVAKEMYQTGVIKLMSMRTW